MYRQRCIRDALVRGAQISLTQDPCGKRAEPCRAVAWAASWRVMSSLLLITRCGGSRPHGMTWMFWKPYLKCSMCRFKFFGLNRMVAGTYEWRRIRRHPGGCLANSSPRGANRRDLRSQICCSCRRAHSARHHSSCESGEDLGSRCHKIVQVCFYLIIHASVGADVRRGMCEHMYPC